MPKKRRPDSDNPFRDLAPLAGIPSDYRFCVTDPTGRKRTFVIRKGQLMGTGRPIDYANEAFRIESRERVRLQDGQDPVWFWRLYQRDFLGKSHHPSVMFRDYVAAVHRDKIEALGCHTDPDAAGETVVPEAVPETLKRLYNALPADSAKIDTKSLGDVLNREPAHVVADHRHGRWAPWIRSHIGRDHHGLWWRLPSQSKDSQPLR